MRKFFLVGLVLLGLKSSAQGLPEDITLGVGAGPLISLHEFVFNRNERIKLPYFGGGLYFDIGYLITPELQISMISSAELWKGEHNVGLRVPFLDPAFPDSFNIINHEYYFWNNTLLLRYRIWRNFGLSAGTSVYAYEVNAFNYFRDQEKLYEAGNTFNHYFKYYDLGVNYNFNTTFQVELLYRGTYKQSQVETVSIRCFYRFL